MPKKRLSTFEKQDMAAIYREGKASQEDLAIQFGVSRTTVRRALHEFGLVTFNSEATTNERIMLDAIKTFGIESTDRLRQVLQRGIQC